MVEKDKGDDRPINNLQDKLLKLHENQNPALLKLVKETMATKLGLMKPTVESTTEGSPTILTEEKDKETDLKDIFNLNYVTSDSSRHRGPHL